MWKTTSSGRPWPLSHSPAARVLTRSAALRERRPQRREDARDDADQEGAGQGHAHPARRALEPRRVAEARPGLGVRAQVPQDEAEQETAERREVLEEPRRERRRDGRAEREDDQHGGVGPHGAGPERRPEDQKAGREPDRRAEEEERPRVEVDVRYQDAEDRGEQDDEHRLDGPERRPRVEEEDEPGEDDEREDERQREAEAQGDRERLELLGLLGAERRAGPGVREDARDLIPREGEVPRKVRVEERAQRRADERRRSGADPETLALAREDDRRDEGEHDRHVERDVGEGEDEREHGRRQSAPLEERGEEKDHERDRRREGPQVDDPLQEQSRRREREERHERGSRRSAAVEDPRQREGEQGREEDGGHLARHDVVADPSHEGHERDVEQPLLVGEGRRPGRGAGPRERPLRERAVHEEVRVAQVVPRVGVDEAVARERDERDERRKEQAREQVERPEPHVRVSPDARAARLPRPRRAPGPGSSQRSAGADRERGRASLTGLRRRG